MVEVRRVLEGEMAALAAERATRAQVAALRRALQAIDTRVTEPAATAWPRTSPSTARSARPPATRSSCGCSSFLEQYLREAMRVTRATRRGAPTSWSTCATSTARSSMPSRRATRRAGAPRSGAPPSQQGEQPAGRRRLTCRAPARAQQLTKEIDHEAPDHRRRRLRRLAPGARRCSSAARSTASRSSSIVLADQFAAAGRPDWATTRACRCASARCSSSARRWRADRFDGVFHLASAVSGECEADFELGLRSNLDSTRALLDALRAAQASAPRARVLQLGRGVRARRQQPDAAAGARRHAAHAADVATARTSWCASTWWPTTRARAIIDGRSARLMTVTVRPGRPNGAASSFFSGIIREPLAGAGGDPAGRPVGVAPGVVAGAHRARA